MMPLRAPWKDFAGNDIFEGDTIIHPSGESGVVRYRQADCYVQDRWRVDYGDGRLSRLCLQIGDRGRAQVVYS